MSEIIKGFKGFNKDLTCKGFQYKEGETYKTDEVKICNKGFHFCEHPLDVLSYYDLVDGVVCEVESLGTIDKEKDGDTKRATTEIKIGKKLSLKDFVNTAVEYVKKECAPKGVIEKVKGLVNASSGYNSKNASSGYNSTIEMTGKDSVGAAIGVNSKIKAAKGCWITLAEYVLNEKKDNYVIKCVKSAKVDGKKIKADAWYELKGGKFVEVK